jgi:TetR/AcrR family transcriptional regulator, regulator of cefoperazone and chloramphenicol sensitivity
LARKGVDGAMTRDIVARAGQANDSAVHYHFGSRHGLLAAILDRHIRRMEEQRKPALDALGRAPTLAAVVAAVVEPVAAELTSEDGRDFLRIIAQLAGHAGVRTGDVPDPVAGTALAGQLALLEESCRAFLPEAVALERVALAITMLTAALADRARRIDEQQLVLLDHDDFVENFVKMLTAALAAPAPEENAHRGDRDIDGQ